MDASTQSPSRRSRRPTGLLPALLALVCLSAGTAPRPETERRVELDVVVERETPAGWIREAGIRDYQVRLLVDQHETEIAFADHCEPPADGDKAEPLRVLLYFDLAHLTRQGALRAFRAAGAWAGASLRPEDEVMIATGDAGLRIVRPLSPVGAGLERDLRDARRALAEAGEGATWDGNRTREQIEEVAAQTGDGERRSLAAVYAERDEARTRRSLEQLTGLLTLFENVPGTKSLLLFQETLRQRPGNAYPGVGSAADLGPEVWELADEANDRSIRIYPVDAGEPGALDDGLLLLAAETGGRMLGGPGDLEASLQEVPDDAACFYRLAFDFLAEESGRTEPLEVRVYGPGSYRARYRHSVGDTTPEERDAEALQAALLAPGEAGAFPVDVSTALLFEDTRGGRVRLQVRVPVAGLRTVPFTDTGDGTREASVKIGARVMPLLGPALAGAVAGPESVWDRVAEERSPWTFARETTLSLPEGEAAERELVVTQELDMPPGDYRVVAAVRDRLARNAGAGVVDFHVSAGALPLGRIHLAILDPQVMLGDSADRGEDTPAGGEHPPEEIAAAPPTLPRRALLLPAARLPAGLTAHLVYGLCNSAPDDEESATGEFAGWGLRRKLVCSGQPIPIPGEGGRISARGAGVPCTVVLDSIPAARLASGSCRFEVTLDRRNAPTEVRVFAFEVLAAPENLATGVQP